MQKVIFCDHNIQAYQRLEKLNVTLTHKSLSRLLVSIGENHDQEVLMLVADVSM